jgi:hypothetical protein
MVVVSTMREPGIAGFADDEMVQELIPTVPRGMVVDVVVLVVDVVDVVELVVVVADGTVVTTGATVVDVVEVEEVEVVEVVEVVVVTVVSYTMVSSADPGAASVLLDESVARVNT